MGKGNTVPRLPQYLDFHSIETSTVPRLPQYLDFHSIETSTVPRLRQYQDFHSTKTSTVPRLPQCHDLLCSARCHVEDYLDLNSTINDRHCRGYINRQLIGRSFKSCQLIRGSSRSC
ncbi:hypothetical protein Bpfe_011456 [Biomphalaria pfeifferi]|uniref:Uncharacterized protein n=1 Tax=Biomphalaria pfeifferi TaxID=112525 RepID=A0AAD8BSQ6_BIOPF|nr:hypothetical protein Bpfe_011456 [Biomphalaria pfeifferi]